METKNNQTGKDKRQIVHDAQDAEVIYRLMDVAMDGVVEVHVEMQNSVQKRGNRYMQALYLSVGFGDCEMAKTN